MKMNIKPEYQHPWIHSKNRVKKATANLYELLWFYGEFWLEPDARRPYTFIMRDIYHQHPLLTVFALAAFFYALGRWCFPVSVLVFGIITISFFIGTIGGHLFWSKEYIPGEQEQPEFNPVVKPRR